MDVIIEDNVLYRFKKKWVNRYCKLVKTNNFSDSVKLLVFTYEESKNKKMPLILRKSYQLISKYVIYGHLHGIHIHNETHVLFIVCKNSVECLAFKEFATMKTWSDKLSEHLNDLNQPASLIYSDKNSLLKSKLDGRLFINCSHISFIRDTSYSEPRLLMSWKIADIVEFGCSKEIRKSSTKNKTDESEHKFIIKASPLCDRAPNFHIFSCSSPKIFCDQLEKLSNQENIHSPNEFDLLRQRSRTDSYNTINRYSNNWSSSEIECSPESASAVSNMFFSDSMSLRVPRFQRSVSEAPRTRSRMDSSISIDEEKEFELTDKNVSMLYNDMEAVISLDLESPVRSATYTWLERYPYEKEPRLQHHRHISETNHDKYRSLTSNIWTIDQRQFGPKSSSSYCSLLNLRSKFKSCLDSSLLEKSSNSSFSNSNEPFQLSLDKNRGLISRRFPKVIESSSPVNSKEKYTPLYVNLEFNSIFDQINKLCSPGTDIDKTIKT